MIVDVPSAAAYTWLLQIMKTILLVDERENRYARNAQRRRSETKKYLFYNCDHLLRSEMLGNHRTHFHARADFEAINNSLSRFSSFRNGTILFPPYFDSLHF